MNYKRINAIDYSRGIAAVLMILGHSFITYPVDISEVWWCRSLEHFIYTFHMELFFFLAGMVYKCGDYRTFIKNKTIRIAIPYLFFGFITLLLKAFGGESINGVEPIDYGIKKMVLYGGNYWFLYVLFIIFLLFPLIETVATNNIIRTVIIAFCVLVRFIIPQTIPLRLDLVVQYMPYFFVGVLWIKIIKWGWKLRHRALWFSGCMLIYIATDFVIRKTGLLNPVDYIRALSMIAVVWLLCEYIDAYSYNFLGLKQFLIDCSYYSLQLYLFNGFLLTFIRIVVCKLMNINSPIIIVGVIWIGNILFTLVSCKWIIPRIPIVRTLCGLKAPNRN
ncbi:MAG: acyltransferase [Lachnospiraceae bacterium]|jgi:fucose 4-O-acetylase-like acetyltransferase|nr:acyltransferase [Lachnospiraceae bacterium]